MTIAGLVGLTILGVSFTQKNEGDKPVFKNYEVIRVVKGEVSITDTTIASTTGYSPADYLADLGFSQDAEISIIDLTQNELEKSFTSNHKNGVTTTTAFELTERTDDSEKIKKSTTANGQQIIRIEKNIVLTAENGEEKAGEELDVDALLAKINLDSIIKAADSETEGEQVVIKKVIISDEQYSEGEAPKNWKTMNTENADFVTESKGPNHKTQVAVWGNDESYTLLIVSDPEKRAVTKSGQSTVQQPNRNTGVQSAQQAKTGITAENSVPLTLNLFPNPAKTNARLALNFNQKAETTIYITDIKGTTLETITLGEYEGVYNHEIDLTEWENGVYVIYVNHGDETRMERLIVE